jgi:hypothetical protein
MRVMLILIALAVLPSASYAGNCDYSWQNASDGSRCGDRAASERYGGK